jgi:beta-N-acetylhexosaminidase
LRCPHTTPFLGLLTALALSAAPVAAQQTPAPHIRTSGPAYSADSLALERLIDTLSLRDRVAQLVMPWIPGAYTAFDDSAFTVLQGWVDSLHVGGIIVSVGSPLDVALKLNRLQQRSRLPLLIAADLEAGSSFRLTGGTPFPTNMGIAAAGGERDAYDVGRITALEGRAVGIHLTFSPVADINNNPANPIINTRSFGEEPNEVARLVFASVRGLQDNGMLATAKHFPGHGDTSADSHLLLPVISAPWSRLDTLELAPFRAAIQAGVAVVMSGHVAMPALASDRRLPATLDPAILTGLLRDSLGFTGMVVTDALDMGALVNTYGAGEAVVMAFLAGADLLLQPSDPRVAIDAMVTAIESGRIPYERLDRSLRRVLQAKRQAGLFTRRTMPLDSVPEVVGNRRFLATARDITERSIVLAADASGTVDSLRAAPRKVALITYGEENAFTLGNTFARVLRQGGHEVTSFRLFPATGAAGLDSARALIRRNRYVIIAASVRISASKGPVGLPNPVARFIEETALRRRTVLVAFGSPYIGMQVHRLRSYLLAWSPNPLSEAAAGRALTGLAPITGHLPVHIPPAFPLGAGLVRGLTTGLN